VNKLKFDSFRKLFSITVTTILLIGFTVIPVSASSLTGGKYNCNTGEFDDTLEFGYFLIGTEDNVTESYSCTGAVFIPSGVRTIEDRGFLSETELTSVNIPDSVTSIGDHAFFENYKLTSVTFLGNTPPTVGVNAFLNVASGAKAKVSYNATGFGVNGSTWNLLLVSMNRGSIDCSVSGSFRIEDYLVMSDTDCKGKAIIPSGVTGIEESVFSDNTILTWVIIPDSVTSIGNSAFRNNTALIRVDFGDSVESIGTYAFTYTGLTTITIPDSVTSIDQAAFENNAALTTVTFLGNRLSIISQSVFAYNPNLRSITIPNSVTSIADWAFESSGLESVTIGNSVTSIGMEAFLYNASLTSVTFLRTAAPPTLGADIFYGVFEGATANVPYNATGFVLDLDGFWNYLTVIFASAPVDDPPTSGGDSGSSSNVATITPAVVKTADASFKLTNRKYLSKFEIRKAISKGRSFKRKPIDIYKYSISKTSKKNCVMSGNYVVALKDIGVCEIGVTRTTAKGAKYKYWVKIYYSK
jgi:hypothetical protein